MSKRLIDKELLEELLGRLRSAQMFDISTKLQEAITQPAEAEGVAVVGYAVTWIRVGDAPEKTVFMSAADFDGTGGPRLYSHREPLVLQFAHLVALSAVTAERDRLRDENANLQTRLTGMTFDRNCRKEERDQLRAEVEALRLDATLGSAIQRACCDLPDGFMISVSLEKDAGTLELSLPDTDAVLDDFDGETFADQIHAAIDAAMAAKEA